MAALERGVRRDLIGAYIDKAKINWAHIALAQLIDGGYVDRVLTTNFDPLISRACALVNSFPAVYDFAASHIFNPDQVSEKAIFHLDMITFIDPAAHDMVAAIAEFTHGEGAHKTLDAFSAPDARAAAVRSVRSWGTACFVGERGQVTLDVSADLLRRQVTLVGSWTFSKQGQAECAEFIAEPEVDVERLFTHRWRLEQAEEAYRLFDTQTTGKAVILPS